MKTVLWFPQLQNPGGSLRHIFPSQLQRQIPPLGIQQPQRQRDMKRFLIRLARRRRTGLAHSQAVAAGGNIVGIADRQFRCSRLMIPTPKLAEIRVICISHRSYKIIAGHRLTIVTLEVEIHTAPEAIRAEQGLDHADHFRALVVDGDSVEIVDFDVGIRTDRMRQRPGVLWKLAAAENPHIINALDPA